jgi:cyclophilin family peptidyl-prolyl cis-trans isomerase
MIISWIAGQIAGDTAQLVGPITVSPRSAPTMTATASPAQMPTAPSFAQQPLATAAGRLHAVFLAACALLLQACGGGGSGDAGSPASTPATVSSATADRLSYGRLSTFTLNGTNLASAASFSATGCDGVTVLAGGSASQQTVSCTPNKALSVRLAVSSGGGEVYSKTLAVPKPRVTLLTSLGSLEVELEPASAPVTVDNFLAYVNAGFYSSTIFHRVISAFVVQGGGFTGVTGTTLTAQTGLRAAIALESNKGLSNLRGTIAMARSNVSDSATSQFFFNTVNNTFLDYVSTAAPGYAVFGHLVGASDLAVIDTMAAKPTRTVGVAPNSNDDVPVTDIVLQSASQTL